MKTKKIMVRKQTNYFFQVEYMEGKYPGFSFSTRQVKNFCLSHKEKNKISKDWNNNKVKTFLYLYALIRGTE